MTSAEFSLWWDEYCRCPWGEYRDSLHTAVIAKTISDYAGKIRKGDPAPLDEFMLQFDRSSSTTEKSVIEEEPDPIAHFKQFMVTGE